jgi:putative Mn2+ efflux pump MntP
VSFSSILALAVALAMDATAAAAARGLQARRITMRDVALVSLLCGGFQAIMPLGGWFLGARLGPVVAAWDHWIAFVLLGGLGVKTMWEARGTEDGRGGGDAFGIGTLLVLAVATSIDAFAVGVTLPLMRAPLVPSVATIGVTTAVLSAGGLFAGRRFGAALGRRLEAFGGLVLLLLGGKILIEHLTAG